MKRRKWHKNLIIALTLVFLYFPIFVLVLFSFNKSSLNIRWEGFTFYWYKELFSNTELLEAFFNTMLVGITSTVVSVIIGTISAVALYKYSFRFKTLINSLLYIPIVIPEVVLGISLLSIYTLFKMELGMGSLILSHIAFSIPFVVINVRSALAQTNPHLEEAAHDLGAGRLTTFFQVLLPTIMPGVKSGALLAFTLSLDDVIISYFTAGPGSNTLPLKIFSMIKTGITPDVNALSTLMLMTTLVILTVYSLINYRKTNRGQEQ
ncbi:MAG: ABC transporter permease [Bacilli bacterium]|nr:ABC transporter permease [Bacilli bacterium]